MLRFRDISITKKLFLIMTIMAVLITAELVVLSYTIKIFSAVRAYVAGEGLWSKAQKNAAYYLMKYSYTHNERDYQEYRKFLQVPLSDHKARLALSAQPIDYQAAREGFEGGRIHPDDIDGVIWLFSTFYQFEYINKAIAVWTDADNLMSEFVKVGDQLHQLISSQEATSSEIEKKLALLDMLNDKLTIVEDEFSYTLGQASRWLENIIFKLIISIAVIVEFTGIFFTILTGIRISRDVNAINKVARNISQDDYSEHVPVTSRDEIGQLAESFNTMMDDLQNSIIRKQQLENKFKSILEGAPDAMVITNQSGQIVLVNACAEKMFGYTRDEMLGEQVESLIPDIFQKRGQANNDVMGLGVELYGRRKNGSEFPVEISLSPVETDEGKLSLAAIRNVTDKKVIEGLLLEKNVQLVNSDLAKDQFMSHVSHELRTPLNGIITMTQLLMRSELSPDQKEQLTIIDESNEQLLSVINQILDFSKVESGNIGVEQVKIDLHELVNKIIASYVIKAKSKNIKVISKIDESAPQLFIGDLVKIRQILLNLLDNAVKFTNQGEILLNVLVRDRDDMLIDLIFEVSDTGIGIPFDVLPKIFKPFSQGDSSMTRKYGGTGLGLAISKKLAEVMDGCIKVESGASGTKFTFIVPSLKTLKLSADDAPVDYAAKQLSALDQKTGRILLVEDNKLNQRTLTILLQQLGYTVVIANDGLEGLKVLAQNSFDLILMDCQMPNMDGFQAAMEIRKSEEGTSHHIPIIGVTAHAMESHRQKCLDSGMDSYISKPFNVVDLNKLINKYILNRRYGENE